MNFLKHYFVVLTLLLSSLALGFGGDGVVGTASAQEPLIPVFDDCDEEPNATLDPNCNGTEIPPGGEGDCEEGQVEFMGDCIPESSGPSECEDGEIAVPVLEECITDPTAGGGEGDCADPDGGDPVWALLCTILTAQGTLSEADADDDDRGDSVEIELVPAGTVPVGGAGACDPTAMAPVDPEVCGPAGAQTVTVQIDLFFGDAPTTDGESATVTPVMILDPTTGEILLTTPGVDATPEGAIVSIPGTTLEDPGFFPDGQGFSLEELHIGVGAPNSNDLDGDGDTDLQELLICGSNPFNADAHCDDIDGDGQEPNDEDPFKPFVPDSDGDGHADNVDNCPSEPNPDQHDLDEDGVGDACDEDKDGDGINNPDDECPTGITGTGSDPDGDGCKNAEDADDDGDGVPDEDDNCRTDPNPNQEDTTEVAAGGEADGVGDACDNDKDGDDVETGTDPDTGLTTGDCDDTDPDVGGPAAFSCETDGPESPVNEVLGALEGDPPSPTGLAAQAIAAIIYPECTPNPESTEEPPAHCTDDPFDQRDLRDTDGQDGTDHPNGQTDLIEERVLYTTTRTDADLDLHIVTPSPGFGAPPADAVQIVLGDPDAEDDVEVLAIVADHFVVPAGVTCVYMADGQPALGQGDTIEDACADRFSAVGPVNEQLAATAAVTEALYTGEDEVPPIVQFVDENSDSVPDAIELAFVDPASCAPAVGDPTAGEVGVACTALVTETVTLGGLPGVPGVPGEEPDADGDGVPDESDQCEDTPEGATVDENGCEVPDDDGDGVPNDSDTCPDTPEGATVDENGCEVDGGDECNPDPTSGGEPTCLLDQLPLDELPEIPPDAGECEEDQISVPGVGECVDDPTSGGLGDLPTCMEDMDASICTTDPGFFGLGIRITVGPLSLHL